MMSTDSGDSLLVSMRALRLQHMYAIVLLLALATILYRRYSSPLRRYPGPFLASFTELWKVWDVASARTNFTTIALHRQYGQVVRTGPNELSISDPELAASIVASGNGFTKSRFYSVFPPVQPKDVFTELDEKLHAQIKRVAGVPYSLNGILATNHIMDAPIDALMERLGLFATTTGRMDLGEFLNYFSSDILGMVAFSTPFGFLSAGYDLQSTLATVQDEIQYCAIAGQATVIDRICRNNPIVKSLLWTQLGLRREKALLITTKAMEVVMKRKPFKDFVSDGRVDILNQLISGHLKTPDTFSEDRVIAVAIGAIFAGSDSTSSTMQAFFWLILKDQRVLDLIISELEKAQEDGRIPKSGRISYAEAGKLTYFQAALKESMRLRPGVGISLYRDVPEPGFTIKGEHVPPGTTLAINGWAVHQDTGVFGYDADKFRPERWLEDPERARRMNQYMVHFGGGSHLCLGRNLALVEMNRTLPHILRDFDIRLTDPRAEPGMKAFFFVIQSGLNIKIKPKLRED